MEVDADGHLICTMSNGTVLDAGLVKGPQGDPGAVSIYPTTAQALEAMSQAQQAALFAQGYRAIVATYNETVTMHALAEDGSLAWIGCNQDTTNLPDNTDFAIAQAGYGGKHGSTIYAADRWMQNDTTERTYTYTTRNGHGALKCSTSTRIQQKLYLVDGQNYTAAFYINNMQYILNFTAAGGSYGNGRIWVNMQHDGTYMYIINDIPDGGIVSEPVLYIGSYTADTLPPYVPKGYAQELAECQRYCLCLDVKTAQPFALGETYGTGNARMLIPAPKQMRSNPAISKSTGNYKLTVNGSQYDVASIDTLVSSGNGIYIMATAPNAPSNYSVTMFVDANAKIVITADL